MSDTETTYPQWKVMVLLNGERTALRETSDETRARRRVRTHNKIGTDPILYRRDTEAGDWYEE